KENYSDARNMLIEVDSGEIRLSTTDMLAGAVTFNVSDTVSIKKEGKISVDAKSLAVFVKAVSGTLNGYITKAGRLMIKCGAQKMSFVPADKNVPIREFDEETDKVLETSGSILSSVLKIAFMAAPDDASTVPALTGLQLITTNGMMYSMTASTTRSAYTWIPVDTLGSGRFLLPKKTCDLLMYYLHDNDNVSLYFDGKRVWFITDRFKLVSAQINGEFPYEAVSKIVQQERYHSLTVDANELEQGLQTCFDLARATGNKHSRITFTANHDYNLFNIATDIPELGDMDWPIVTKKQEGQGFIFTLLSKYIEEVLKAI
ncbi:unnamed protein product, partial [marine sediment metagenome]